MVHLASPLLTPNHLQLLTNTIMGISLLKQELVYQSIYRNVRVRVHTQECFLLHVTFSTLLVALAVATVN
jgi:hypothetical protein